MEFRTDSLRLKLSWGVEAIAQLDLYLETDRGTILGGSEGTCTGVLLTSDTIRTRKAWNH